MAIFTAVGSSSSMTGISSLTQLFTNTTTTSTDASSFTHHYYSFSALLNPCKLSKSLVKRPPPSFCTTTTTTTTAAHLSISATAAATTEEESEKVVNGLVRNSPDDVRQARRSADWKAARAYKESQFIYEGRIEGFNGGGLLVQFYSLVGFLPFPELSSSHSCKDSHKSIQETAKGLVGSLISMKVIQAEENKRRLIFSEKEAVWTMFSKQINVGDIFHGRVGAVEDYGAFVHLRFPDGYYHLTGLVHVSEVSWDLVQDVRDILNEGDEVRVKVIKVDREKLRITLSIKQLEEDPLLETLDKVIPQDGSVGFDSANTNNEYNIEPLPGLETIFEELLREDGISDVRITRQGFEKKVVSQDLQLWLSNAPAVDQQFTLLARAGRQVQEIQLTTSLDQEGIKRALQRVLERVP